MNTNSDAAPVVAQAGTAEPDLDEARRFVDLLAPGEPVTLQTFSDRKPKGPDPLAKIMHGRLEEHAGRLAALNGEGAGVFVCVNATNGRGRQAKNVTRVRALFVDLDGAPIAPVLALPAYLRPHIVVESSPGKWHCYWIVIDCALDRFKPIQQALAARFNGDASVHDLPRVLRVPGYLHRKAEPFRTRIDRVRDAPPFKVEALVEGLGLVVGKRSPPVKTRAASITEAAAGDPVAVWLHEQGRVLDIGRDGQLFTPCPNAAEHTSESGPTECCYFPRFTGGFEQGHWKCLHAHCANKPDRYFTNLLDMHEFPDLSLDPEAIEAAAEATARANASAQAVGSFLGLVRHWTPKADAAALVTVVPVEYLVEPWIQHGQAGALVAEGGTGKTTIKVLLGISIATGRPFLGLSVCRRGTFVLLSLDDSQADLDAVLAEIVVAEKLSLEEIELVRTKVRLISLRGATGAANFSTVDRGAVTPTGVEARIAEVLSDIPDLQCVALDTLRMFSGGGSNDERVMTIATMAVTTIAQRLGCTVIVSHHTGKGQSRDGADDQYVGSGSSAIGDNLRFILRLRSTTWKEMAEEVAVQEMAPGDLLRLSSQRGSLRMKTPTPVYLTRNGFEIRPVVGRRKVQSDRDNDLLERLVPLIEDGHDTSNKLHREMGGRKADLLAGVGRLVDDGYLERVGSTRGGPLKVTRKGRDAVSL